MKKTKYKMSILPLIMAVLSIQLNHFVSEFEAKEYLNDNPIEIFNFLNENLQLFVSSYNDSCSAEKWLASYVEDSFEISVILPSYTYKGVFADFDNENGYTIIGKNYEFLNFKTKGESPLKNIKADEYCFYPNTSCFTYIKNGTEFDLDGFSNDYYEKNKEVLFNEKLEHYGGQEDNLNGCGGINNPDEYIKSRYGDGWKNIDTMSLDINNYSQNTLSVYFEKINENVSNGEGNCWVVSGFNALQGLQKMYKKYKKIDLGLPSSDSKSGVSTKYKPSEDEKWVYDQYKPIKKYSKDYKGDAKGYYLNNEVLEGYYYDKSTRKTVYSWKNGMPNLYLQMRKFLNNNKRVPGNGGTIWETSWLIENTAKYYGLNIDGVEHFDWKSYAGSKGIEELKNYKPLIWSTMGDTYKKHSMVVCGYKKYEKVTQHSIWLFGWINWSTTESVLLYEIGDGWTGFDISNQTAPTRFYDMSAHIGIDGIINLEVL